jgi:hypothetical protein
MLLCFEAVWPIYVHSCGPTVAARAVSCCSLHQETPVRFGAVIAPAFRYSIGNGTDTDVWTIL